MSNSTAAMENTVVFPQKLKTNDYMIQQFHLRVYIQNNWQQDREEIFANPCS